MTESVRQIRPWSGSLVCALVGLIAGNFVLAEQSAALASFLSAHFGSTWFFEDLLLHSFSPLGLVLGAAFGLVLFDLPCLCVRHLRRDRLQEVLLRLQADTGGLQALCSLAGFVSAAGRVNMLQRRLLLKMLLRIGTVVDDERELEYTRAFFNGAASLKPDPKALQRLNSLCKGSSRRPFALWLCSRLFDFASADFDFGPGQEDRILLITGSMSLPEQDVQSLLHLRLSAACDRLPSLQEQALAHSPWFLPAPAADGADAEQEAGFDNAHFDEDAALAAARTAQAQGRGLSLAEAYIVLGLTYEAPKRQVQKRFLQLMLRYHPDRLASGSSPMQRRRATLLCSLLLAARDLILRQ